MCCGRARRAGRAGPPRSARARELPGRPAELRAEAGDGWHRVVRAHHRKVLAAGHAAYPAGYGELAVPAIVDKRPDVLDRVPLRDAGAVAVRPLERPPGAAVVRDPRHVDPAVAGAGGGAPGGGGG